MSKTKQFAFMRRNLSRRRQPSSAEQLLEAIVAAFRDKKPRHHIESLLRCYPYVMNRASNPFHAMLETIERYESRFGSLPGATVVVYPHGRRPNRANASRKTISDLMWTLVNGTSFHTSGDHSHFPVMSADAEKAFEELKKLTQPKDQPCHQENQQEKQ